MYNDRNDVGRESVIGAQQSFEKPPENPIQVEKRHLIDQQGFPDGFLVFGNLDMQSESNHQFFSLAAPAIFHFDKIQTTWEGIERHHLLYCSSGRQDTPYQSTGHVH